MTFRVFRDAYDALAAVPATDEFVGHWFRAAAAAVAYEQSQVERSWPEFSDALSAALNDAFSFGAHVDPGELALTRALPFERFAWGSLYQDRRIYVTAEQEALRQEAEKQLLGRLLDGEKQAIPRALVELRKAEAFESARPESLMRQGALEAMGRVAEAEASYRAALALRPKARSGNLALSALLFAHGVRADANLLTVFDPASDRFDPWGQLTYGAYRFWPDRRDAMRRFLK